MEVCAGEAIEVVGLGGTSSGVGCGDMFRRGHMGCIRGGGSEEVRKRKCVRGVQDRVCQRGCVRGGIRGDVSEGGSEGVYQRRRMRRRRSGSAVEI